MAIQWLLMAIKLPLIEWQLNFSLKSYTLCRPSQLPFGGLGWGTIVAPWEPPGNHFGSSGPPWRTIGAAGWTRGGPEQDFHRFWRDFGILFWEFFGHRGLKIQFCFGLVCRPLCSSTSVSKFRRWGLLIQGFRKERIAKINFSQTYFVMDFGVELCIGSSFSGFLCLDNKLEN